MFSNPVKKSGFGRLTGLYLLLGSFACGLVGTEFLPFEHETSGAVAGVLLFFLIFFVHPALWSRLVGAVTSVELAIIGMLLTTVLTLLGTLLIQDGTLAQYHAIYGETLSHIIFFLGFHELFYSPLLNISLTLLWVALVILLYIRITKITVRSFGTILMHLSVVVILCGGYFSRVSGDKGMLPIYENQTLDQYEVNTTPHACYFNCRDEDIKQQSSNGHKKVRRQLPFSISLNSFSISYYDQKYRLYLYEFNHHTKLYRPITSWNLKTLEKGIAVSGHTILIRDPNAGTDSTRTLEIAEKSDPTKKRTILVDAYHPKPVMLGQLSTKVVVFELTSKMVKEYLSNVTVVEKGGAVSQHEIKVNHPLSFQGYTIYQSSYDPSNPNFSIFQIVYDPGLWWVYSGFMILLIGMIWSIFCGPLIGEGKK